jgi:energy-coupling factor transporter ATP-binding protein EcfA2
MSQFQLNFDSEDEHGRPLGFIHGGSHEGEIVYLNSVKHKTKSKIDNNEIAVLIEALYRNMGNKVNMKTMERLREAILDRKRPANREIAQLYDMAIKMLDNGKNKEILLDEDSKLNPMFDTTRERDVQMVCGMSGSGKSTYVSGLCKVYKRQYPSNKVILFSNKPSDPVFDNLAFVERVVINDELLTDPITLNELSNAFVIFDDVECQTNKDIDKELTRLSDLILQQGRSYKTSFAYVSHQSNNYKATRNILNESHSITIFPAMVTKYSLKYLLGTYFGFGKDEIKRLSRLPSRWVTICKAPSIVLYSGGAYLTDN